MKIARKEESQNGFFDVLDLFSSLNLSLPDKDKSLEVNPDPLLQKGISRIS